MNLDKLKTGWGLIVSIIVGLSIIVSTSFAIDSYYAHSEDLIQLALRMDQKINNDKIIYTQNEIWRLEDRYKCRTYITCSEKMNSDALIRYRELMQRLENLKKKEK